MFNKNEVIYSDGIGVCKVSDIVNLQVNKRPPMQYYLLSSVFDKKKTSYIPVSGHQVVLRHLITVDAAKEKVTQESISEFEKSEIEYVIGNNGTIYEEKEDLNGRE
ncbi:MAG: CarD-like/TRCF domain protein [Lachnospiraceae bacterium]|nr:CarD-like/TRCF domain protein [Lachnospiraceae bacterium]